MLARDSAPAPPASVLPPDRPQLDEAEPAEAHEWAEAVALSQRRPSADDPSAAPPPPLPPPPPPPSGDDASAWSSPNGAPGDDIWDALGDGECPHWCEGDAWLDALVAEVPTSAAEVPPPLASFPAAPGGVSLPPAAAWPAGVGCGEGGAAPFGGGVDGARQVV